MGYGVIVRLFSSTDGSYKETNKRKRGRGESERERETERKRKRERERERERGREGGKREGDKKIKHTTSIAILILLPSKKSASLLTGLTGSIILNIYNNKTRNNNNNNNNNNNKHK